MCPGPLESPGFMQTDRAFTTIRCWHLRLGIWRQTGFVAFDARFTTRSTSARHVSFQ